MTRAHERRPVYVAGAGAITPLGADWASSLARLAAGESAVARVEHFDVQGFPCTVAASIAERLDDAEDRRLILARRAARDALAAAPIAADIEPERIGVFIGAESGRASLPTILALARAAGGGATFEHRAFGERARELAGRIDASAVSPAAVAVSLARELGALGPAPTVSIACASSGASIIEAVRCIRQGVCDVALAGGVGADVDPLMLVGFGKLGALSARGVSCPFDVRRDGFVVGEGAAMVVLCHRPVGLGVRVTGVGRTLDAHHLTAPDPAGDGAVRAMRAALADAARDPTRRAGADVAACIDYIQAHGTSTPLNDRVEAGAIRQVFGPRADHILVSSVKGALGHWVAGAGALGFLCALAAVRGTVLPTAGLCEPDPECALRHVMERAQHQPVRAALVNSFAFGGANASIVLERATSDGGEVAP